MNPWEVVVNHLEILPNKTAKICVRKLNKLINLSLVGYETLPTEYKY